MLACIYSGCLANLWPLRPQSPNQVRKLNSSAVVTLCPYNCLRVERTWFGTYNWPGKVGKHASRKIFCQLLFASHLDPAVGPWTAVINLALASHQTSFKVKVDTLREVVQQSLCSKRTYCPSMKCVSLWKICAANVFVADNHITASFSFLHKFTLKN